MVNKFLGHASQICLVANEQMVVILSADWQSC